MEVQHGGCFICKSRDEAVLTSGQGLGRGLTSIAVCSKPECRSHVELLRN